MAEERQDRYDDKALKHFEKRLLEERRLVLRELGVLAEVMGATEEARTGELSSYRFHMADTGTETMEQEQTMLMASKEGRLLQHIDEALRHLYKTPETFGVCERCGRLIGFDRLDAIPHTRLCITCAKTIESAPRPAPAPPADEEAETR